MDRIHKLPFLIGGFMAVLTGSISYACGSDNQSTYVRMAVVLVVFYIIGIFIRNTLKTIHSELEEKKRQEQLREQEAAQVEAIEKAAAEAQEKAAAQNAVKQNMHKLDLVADDSLDEFTPLNISQAIGGKLKK